MIITFNTRSEFMPGALIVDKNKGVYGVVLSLNNIGAPIESVNIYKVKSLNTSKYWLIRKFQLYIIKNAFK